MAISLEGMKVGDRALFIRSGIMREVKVEKVGKIHVTAGGRKHSVRNGRDIHGSDWSSGYLHTFDQERLDAYLLSEKEELMRRDLVRFDWRKLKGDKLVEVHTLTQAIA